MFRTLKMMDWNFSSTAESATGILLAIAILAALL